MARVSESTSENRASDFDRLLNEHEAAALLGYTVRALQNWRFRGGGPAFVKVSERSVRYRRRDLASWIESRIRTSTSDPGQPAATAGRTKPGSG